MIAAVASTGPAGAGARKVARAVLVALALSFLLLPSSGSSALAPTIASDKADYAPGEAVTLTGANWQPGESVHILVNDDAGQTWSHSADATAAADGTINDQFVLPDWFVATYIVTATGAGSGTATTTFTDSVISASITSPTTTSPVTVTSLPASVTISFNYSTSTAGTTTGEARVFSATTTTIPIVTKTLASGAPKSDSIVVPIPAGTPNGSYNAQVKVTNGAGAGANQKVDTQPDAVIIRLNQAPTVSEISGSASVTEGTVAAYSVSATDPDGDTLTYAWSITGGNASIVGSASSSTVSIRFTDGPSTVGLQVVVDDQHGHTVTRTKTVAETNVAPVVTLTGPDAVDESISTARTFTYTATDAAGANDPLSRTFDCGANGTFVLGSDTGSSFQCKFPDGGPATPSPTVSTVSVSANDGDGGVASASKQVTVNNVAPTVTLAAGNERAVDEGTTTHTYSYTIFDPGLDTVSAVSTSCGTGGTKVALSDTNTDTSGSFQCRFPDGPATTTVSASATDSDGATGAAGNQTVTVNNVAPTVTLAGPDVVDESTSVGRTFNYTASDPAGANDPLTFSFSCGANGSLVTNSDTGSSFQCIFRDGGPTTSPTLSTVSVFADDGDSGIGSASKQVTVNNVAPTVTLSGPDVVEESTTAARTFNYTASDPAGTNDPLTFSFSCGANGSVVANSGSSFQCKFPDGAVTPATVSTVSVSADDGDGGVGSASKQVTVRNVAPTVALSSGDTSIPEGSSATTSHTYTFAISDPGADAITTFTAGCGPQGTKTAQSLTGRTGTVTCTFSSTLLSDGPNSTTISASATDDDDATGPTLTVVITITNVAPIVTPKIPSAISSSKVFFTVNAVASFIDPGKKDAPWSGRIEWGDGTATDPTGISTSNGSGTISATHAYTTPGTYVITFKVKDKDRDAGAAAVTIVITS